MWLYVDYEINRARYEKNCINKARPKLKCNGKCQLAKKIQEEEKKNQENAEKKAEVKLAQVLSSRHFFATIDVWLAKRSQDFHALEDLREIKMPRSFFHPPSLPFSHIL
ncbi:hypothetical protein ABDK00_008945 [Niabella insulamsoli]|uniref:hypothetical protein n=1 Tax=Niabella insulamsoli TaxID=3144874 RepID=UPI0031FC0E12